MKKYIDSKLTNEKTNQVYPFFGTNTEWARSNGYTMEDVQQSDVDGQWYLAEKCPMKTEEEKLNEAKTNKYNEINNGAREYLESGNALFEIEEGKHIEATDGNIAKLSAYALSFMTGVQEVVYWNTKEDETISLNQEQLTQALMGLGEVQATVWNVKFPYYLKLLENAQTIEEVNAITVDYSLPIPDETEVTEDENTTDTTVSTVIQDEMDTTTSESNEVDKDSLK